MDARSPFIAGLALALLASPAAAGSIDADRARIAAERERLAAMRMEALRLEQSQALFQLRHQLHREQDRMMNMRPMPRLEVPVMTPGMRPLR